MHRALLVHVRPLVRRFAAELTDLAVKRIEAELEHISEAFDVAISAYASERAPDLITAALGPELARMLEPPQPGRYVRFAIPPGVPGCEPIISCRANDGLGMDSITEHTLPAGAVIVVRLPSLDGSE